MFWVPMSGAQTQMLDVSSYIQVAIGISLLIWIWVTAITSHQIQKTPALDSFALFLQSALK